MPKNRFYNLLRIKIKFIKFSVKVPREEREQYRLSHRSDTNQVVSRLDYSAWQNLVKKYGIQVCF